jgi:hypothetical protein
MNPDEFDQTLRSLTNREPFEPFVVERKDGTSVTVTHPNVAFGGGAAGLIDADGALVNFSYEEVLTIRKGVPEAAS